MPMASGGHGDEDQGTVERTVGHHDSVAYTGGDGDHWDHAVVSGAGPDNGALAGISGR